MHELITTQAPLPAAAQQIIRGTLKQTHDIARRSCSFIVDTYISNEKMCSVTESYELRHRITSLMLLTVLSNNTDCRLSQFNICLFGDNHIQ